MRDFPVPFYGLYGACSTMAKAFPWRALLVSAGYLSRAAAVTSSHFCSAERQYRMAHALRRQRCPTAQWTATAAGCTILAAVGNGPYITHVTRGRVIDKGITDANNMGAAMAPAALDTLQAFFVIQAASPAILTASSQAIWENWAVPFLWIWPSGKDWICPPTTVTAAYYFMTWNGRICTVAAPAAAAAPRCSTDIC